MFNFTTEVVLRTPAVQGGRDNKVYTRLHIIQTLTSKHLPRFPGGQTQITISEPRLKRSTVVQNYSLVQL